MKQDLRRTSFNVDNFSQTAGLVWGVVPLLSLLGGTASKTASKHALSGHRCVASATFPSEGETSHLSVHGRGTEPKLELFDYKPKLVELEQTVASVGD
ncbi:MAG: hypothetical protein R3C02_10010 [Planctomycetaceae bacterium]